MIIKLLLIIIIIIYNIILLLYICNTIHYCYILYSIISDNNY